MHRTVDWNVAAVGLWIFFHHTRLYALHCIGGPGSLCPLSPYFFRTKHFEGTHSCAVEYCATHAICRWPVLCFYTAALFLSFYLSSECATMLLFHISETFDVTEETKECPTATLHYHSMPVTASRYSWGGVGPRSNRPVLTESTFCRCNRTTQDIDRASSFIFFHRHTINKILQKENF